MPSLTPNPSGVGRSGAAGGGARNGHTCSAPESTALPRCLRCRWLRRLQDAMRAQCQPLHHLWLLPPPPGAHPTCHNPPLALHQLDGRSHGAPGFHPLIHQEDAHTWGGVELYPMSIVAPLQECPPHRLSSPGVTVSVRTSITFSRPE